MSVAFVVILILCSPLILGPLVIPAMKRAKTEKALERVCGSDGELLPAGLTIVPAALKTGGAPRRCEVQVDANLTKVDCGGVLHWVLEETPGTQQRRLTTVCFLCARFEKWSQTSVVLGKHYESVIDLPTLENSIRYAKLRERDARRAA